MTTKKASRPAATGNGSRTTKFRIILADQHFKNKVHNALLRGSFAGAVFAMIIGVLHMESSILEGLMISGVGIIWGLVFYMMNPNDKIFDGGAYEDHR